MHAEKLHASRHGGSEETAAATLVVSLDYFFLGLTDNTGEGTTSTLVLCDSNTTYSLGLVVPTKGPVPYAVRGVCVFLQELGYTRMNLDSKNFQTQLIPRTSHVDHASNGAAEAMVHSLEGLTRTSKVALEEPLGVSILSNSPILILVLLRTSQFRSFGK